MADEFDTNELSMLSDVGEGKRKRKRKRRASRSRSRSRSASRSDKRGRGSTAREARQRRRTSVSDSNLEETKEQAGEQKSHGKYPVQFKLLYSTYKKQDKPIAMARVLNAWEFFRIDEWTEEGQLLHIDGLPEKLVQLTRWNSKAWDQLKSLLIEMMEEIEIDLNDQWSLQSGITDLDEEGIDRLVQKYDELPEEAIYYCNDFRKALIVRPSCSNTIGRTALFNLAFILWHLMPRPYKHRCQPFNVGGGASTWEGNCKIGYVFCNQKSLTDEQLGDLLQKGSVRTQHMRVCDFQIIDQWKRYWLSGEIKTVEDMVGTVKEWDARRQTWEQCLSGLRDDIESYAILLTPKKAELFQLRLDPSKRALFTYTKTYRFRSKKEGDITLKKFATDQLEKLMADFMGIMFRGSVNIRDRDSQAGDSAGGSSSKQ